MKKTESIKKQIILMFVQSMFLSAVLTGACMLIFAVLFELVWKDGYTQFIVLYQKSYAVDAAVLAGVIVLFALITFIIFTKKLNVLTEAIRELSDSIHSIAAGDFTARAAVIQSNELGSLADDINTMAAEIDRLLKREKELNKERYNMITNMSHDLKTPMMSIMGYVDLISSHKYENEQELDKYCRIISDKTVDLNHNIGQLFELSKVSSFDYRLEKQKIGLYEFTAQMLMEYTPEFAKEGMEYRIDIDPELTIDADVNALRRVYENIVSNALKYASEGKLLNISAKSENRAVSVDFINYGHMIPKETCDRIFNRFFQEKKNSGKEGSGCGLYIVKEIMERHGGSVSVQSDKESTVFEISFPIKVYLSQPVS